MKHHSPRSIMALLAAMACTPRSSEHGVPGDDGQGGNSQRPFSGPPRSVIERPDVFANSPSRLFALNPGAASLSVFDLSDLTSDKPVVSNQGLPIRPRVLVASADQDLGLVLLPADGEVDVACADVVPAPSPVAASVEAGTDTSVLRRLDDGSTLVALFSGRMNPFGAPTGLHLIKIGGCKIAENRHLTPESIGSGPYQVQLATDGQYAYVASHSGVTRLDLNDSDPIGTQLTADVVQDMTLFEAGGDYLAATDAEGLVVLPGDGGPLHRVELPTSTDSGGAGGMGSAGENAGGAAGEPAAVPSVSNATFAVAASSKLLLATDGSTLFRQDLPPLQAPFGIASEATALVLGSSDDCALAYTPGGRALTKLKLDPLSATTIRLDRRISSVELACRPDGDSPCCDGLAIVVYETTPSPLGQSEAYSLVDLATGERDLRLSSAPVVGISTFDQGNAILLAFADPSGARHRFSLLTPFATSDSRQLDGDLDDLPTSVGKVGAAGSVAFVGLERHDGDLLLFTRQPAKPVAPSSYDQIRLRDFRLSEDVRCLPSGGAAGTDGACGG